MLFQSDAFLEGDPIEHMAESHENRHLLQTRVKWSQHGPICSPLCRQGTIARSDGKITEVYGTFSSLQWHHNERHCV